MNLILRQGAVFTPQQLEAVALGKWRSVAHDKGIELFVF
jgi:hypothetical protein